MGCEYQRCPPLQTLVLRTPQHHNYLLPIIMHTWEVGTGISSGIWGSGDLGLVSVECCKERVLERRVLGRLLEVIMHLASRREDTLHSCR